MKFGKRLLSFILLFILAVGLFAPALQVFAVGEPVINASYRKTSDTSAVITVTTQNISSTRLPNGNWTSDSTINYTVSQNGTYSFEGLGTNGTRIQKNVTIQDLRQTILITANRNILLELKSEDTLSGVDKMRFRNESNGSWSSYEPYATTKNWTVNAGDGLKTVYVQYRDLAGNEADPVTDMVYLDNTAPTVSFKINGGDAYTKTPNVNLSIISTDNLSRLDKMYVSNNGSTWTEYPYTSDIPWTLTSGLGQKTVYLKVSDAVGNVSSVVTSTIFLDNVLPYGSILINGGDTATNSRNVTLSINFGDAHSGIKRVRVLEGTKSYEYPTVPTSPTVLPWTLSMGLTGQVTLEITDNAGNIFTVRSNIINIITLEITQFKLTDVVNPSRYNTTNPFIAKAWDFPPEPMMAGGDISFEIFYNLFDEGSISSTTRGDYIIEIIGPDGYHFSRRVDYEDVINFPSKGFSDTFTLPIDAPKNSMVYLTSTIYSSINTSLSTIESQAVFPVNGAKAQIGYIEGNIREEIRFNEIR